MTPGLKSMFVSVALSASLAGGVAFADPFKIGIVGPLTGPAATSGLSLQKGMQLAIDEWNAKGGVTFKGQKEPIEVLWEDSQSKPAVGVSAAEKLLQRDNVEMIIGDLVHSSVAMALMDISAGSDVPFFSAYPTATDISTRIAADKDSYGRFWKGMFNSDAYTRGIVHALKTMIDKGDLKPEKKTMAFLVEDTDFGRSLAPNTVPLLEELGWTISLIETVPVGHTDFYPQMSKIKNDAPDVVISGFTALASGVALTRQYVETGVDSLHLGVFYPELPAFAQQAGDAASGLVWLPTYIIPDDFRGKIKDKFDIVDIGHDYTFGYDLMNVALEAIEGTKDTRDMESLREGFLAVDYSGISGRWVFDPESQTAKDGPEFIPILVGQFQNGIERTVISPEDRANTQYIPQPWLK